MIFNLSILDIIWKNLWYDDGVYVNACAHYAYPAKTIHQRC